jgi:hypothetical protein
MTKKSSKIKRKIFHFLNLHLAPTIQSEQQQIEKIRINLNKLQPEDLGNKNNRSILITNHLLPF